MNRTPWHTSMAALTLVSAGVLVGCAPGPGGVVTTSSSGGSNAPVPSVSGNGSPAHPAPSKTQRVTPSTPPGTSPTPSANPVPPPIGRRNAILSDLARRGVNPGSVSGWDATYVTWNDGSLGCPTPGQVYTQALVPGMRVLVTANGRSYDYRFGRDDVPMLCTNPVVGPMTPSTH